MGDPGSGIENTTAVGKGEIGKTGKLCNREDKCFSGGTPKEEGCPEENPIQSVKGGSVA